MLEKKITYERIDIDLDSMPDWLARISPSLQVPVVQVSPDNWLFESGVIVRYLDGTSGGGLLPDDPLIRARHEAWMSYADRMLNIVARIIYQDADATAVESSLTELSMCLETVQKWFAPQGYFAGPGFGLIDAVFATLFRYFPVLDMVSKVKLETVHSGVLGEWWKMVRCRPSVVAAVPHEYETELMHFIAAKSSYAGHVLALEITP